MPNKRIKVGATDLGDLRVEDLLEEYSFVITMFDDNVLCMYYYNEQGEVGYQYCYPNHNPLDKHFFVAPEVYIMYHETIIHLER